jgi:hypothetical protein
MMPQAFRGRQLHNGVVCWHTDTNAELNESLSVMIPASPILVPHSRYSTRKVPVQTATTAYCFGISSPGLESETLSRCRSVEQIRELRFYGQCSMFSGRLSG